MRSTLSLKLNSLRKAVANVLIDSNRDLPTDWYYSLIGCFSADLITINSTKWQVPILG